MVSKFSLFMATAQYNFLRFIPGKKQQFFEYLEELSEKATGFHQFQGRKRGGDVAGSRTFWKSGWKISELEVLCWVVLRCFLSGLFL